MEAERKREKQPRQVSNKRTAFNIKEERSAKAAEARENSPALTALRNFFLPGAGPGHGKPKYATDKYGNRVLIRPNKSKDK